MHSSKFSERLIRSIPLLLIAAFTLFSLTALISINNLQGDARVINYAGIVRGATQRLVKQEMCAIPDDPLIGQLDQILAGLAAGDDALNLNRMDCPEFQVNVQQLQDEWRTIKAEILRVRAGADQQRLYDLSETYFQLADRTVTAAEVHTEGKVHRMTLWLLGLTLAFAFVVLLFAQYHARQKRMSAKLAAAELASLEKSSFLSRLSHEIRTPMNGIIGMTALAQMYGTDTEKVSNCLHKIQLSSEYMVSLINDILDMSRIESGKIELYCTPLDLHTLTSRLETMFSQKAQDAGVTFDVRLPALPAPVLVGDELRLSQVIVNLVSNAIKFTPEGGRVTVEIDETDVQADDVQLRIQVSDTGIGMSEAFQARMFNPFEQAESATSHIYGGSGLGLAISHSLVTLMGGEIAVDSAPGCGTRFCITVRLPRAAADAVVPAAAPDPSEAQEDNLNGYHILLAEDNEINAEIASAILEHTGANVTHVWNGKEAVTAFAEAEPNTYDVVLMDTQMPELDGLSATRSIRASAHPQAHSIPIIGLSANAFQKDVDEALQSGMNAYLSKPIDLRRLLQTITQLRVK